MQITVHTKENCKDCEKVKSILSKKGIPFSIEELTPETAAMFSEKGVRQAPVVEYGDEVWGGFNIRKMAELVRMATV